MLSLQYTLLMSQIFSSCVKGPCPLSRSPLCLSFSLSLPLSVFLRASQLSQSLRISLTLSFLHISLCLSLQIILSVSVFLSISVYVCVNSSFQFLIHSLSSCLSIIVIKSISSGSIYLNLHTDSTL